MSVTEKLRAYRYGSTTRDLPWRTIRSVNIAALETEETDLRLLANLTSILATSSITSLTVRDATNTDLYQLLRSLQATLQFVLWSQNVLKEQLVSTQQGITTHRVASELVEHLEAKNASLARTLDSVTQERDTLALSSAGLNAAVARFEGTVRALEQQLRYERERAAAAEVRSTEAIALALTQSKGDTLQGGNCAENNEGFRVRGSRLRAPPDPYVTSTGGIRWQKDELGKRRCPLCHRSRGGLQSSKVGSDMACAANVGGNGNDDFVQWKTFCEYLLRQQQQQLLKPPGSLSLQPVSSPSSSVPVAAQSPRCGDKSSLTATAQRAVDHFARATAATVAEEPRRMVARGMCAIRPQSTPTLESLAASVEALVEDVQEQLRDAAARAAEETEKVAREVSVLRAEWQAESRATTAALELSLEELKTSIQQFMQGATRPQVTSSSLLPPPPAVERRSATASPFSALQVDTTGAQPQILPIAGSAVKPTQVRAATTSLAQVTACVVTTTSPGSVSLAPSPTKQQPLQRTTPIVKPLAAAPSAASLVSVPSSNVTEASPIMAGAGEKPLFEAATAAQHSLSQSPQSSASQLLQKQQADDSLQLGTSTSAASSSANASKKKRTPLPSFDVSVLKTPPKEDARREAGKAAATSTVTTTAPVKSILTNQAPALSAGGAMHRSGSGSLHSDTEQRQAVQTAEIIGNGKYICNEDQPASAAARAASSMNSGSAIGVEQTERRSNIAIKIPAESFVGSPTEASLVLNNTVRSKSPLPVVPRAVSPDGNAPAPGLTAGTPGNAQLLRSHTAAHSGKVSNAGSSAHSRSNSGSGEVACRHCEQRIPALGSSVHEANCEMRLILCRKCHQKITARALPTHKCGGAAGNGGAVATVRTGKTTVVGVGELNPASPLTPLPHSRQLSPHTSFVASDSGSVRASSLMLLETQKELQALMEEDEDAETVKKAGGK